MGAFRSRVARFYLYTCRAFHYHVGPFQLREAPSGSLGGGLRRHCNSEKQSSSDTIMTATET